MKTKYFISAFLLLVCNIVLSQNLTQTIKGTVVDKANQTPLIGATIIIENTQPLIGATTDVDGNFKIEKVPIGRQKVKVGYMGYENYVIQELMVGTGKEISLKIELKESISTLKTVEIKANSNKTQSQNTMAIVSARQLSVEEASRYAGGFNDPARLATSFAGVAGGMANNAIVIRGNSPRGLLWQMEGVEISNPNHFANVTTFGGGGITALSSQMLNNSDFFTGAFPAEYSNALSGVFDLKLRNGNNEKYEHTVQLGIIGTDISSEGPFIPGKKSSYLFNYRYSTFSLITPLLPEDAEAVKYQDLSFKFNFPTKKAGVFYVWGLTASDYSGQKAVKDTLEWIFDNDKTKVSAKQGMGAGGFGNKMIINKNTLLSTSLSLSGNILDWDKYELSPLLNEHKTEDINYTNGKISFSTYVSKKFSARHSNKTGVILNRLYYDITTQHATNLSSPLQTVVKENGFSHLMQFYTQSNFDITQKISFNAGIHSQVLTLNNNFTVEPRLGIKFMPNNLNTFSLGYGNHAQTEMIGFYLCRVYDGNTYHQPNKNLDFSKAHHFVISYDRQISEYLHCKVEPYYQYLYNIPVIPNSSFSMINLDKNWFFADSLVNKGKGLNYGLDITWERFMNKGFYYLITASIFDSKYKADDGKWRNTRYNKNFVFNVLAGKEWTLGKKNKNQILGISGKITYSGGDRITPLNLPISLAAKQAIEDDYNAFEEKKENMVFLNFTCSYRINKNKYASIISFEFINMLGTKEFYGYRYNNNTNAFEKEMDATIVPNLSYKIEF